MRPPPQCLVLRAIGLGDLLAGVPALRALRRALPGWEVSLATPAVLSDLVELADVADRVVPTVELGPIAWEGRPPDLAVDLHGNGPASKAPLLALDPRRLLAFAGPGPDGRPHPGPRWRLDEHEVHRWCRLVAEGLGAPADPADLLLARPARTPSDAPVVIHPGAASGSRRWPVERFADVAAWAVDRAPVVVTGSAAELPLAEEVRRRADLPEASVVAGGTDLLALAGLVAGASLVVSGDTGVAHLAAAYRTPSVVLFGPTPPAWWGPPAEGPHVALWGGDPTRPMAEQRGDPHGSEPDPRLLAIGVEEVTAAAVSLLPALPEPLPGPHPSARSA